MSCNVCGNDDVEFYSSNKSTCKECVKKRVRENRKDKIEYYREFDRKRNATEKRVAARIAYQKTERGRQVCNACSRRHYARNKDAVLEKQRVSRIENPEKHYAREQVAYAVKTGKIEKPDSCSVCGDKHDWIHGHHDDYSKPLDVRWLCPPCHKEAHSF